MRRKDREVTSCEALKEIIDKCMVCRVAMQDETGLYIVPMNFGYEFDGEKLTLYFHSAKAGRKVDIMAKGADVAFEMDCDHELIAHEIACRNGFAYSSIIGNGKATQLEEPEEKLRALQLIMVHQTGKEFDMPLAAGNAVALFKLESTSFAGKQRLGF